MNPVGKKWVYKVKYAKKRQEYTHLCSRRWGLRKQSFSEITAPKKQNNRNKSKIAALPTASNLESAKIHAANYLSHGLGGSSNHLSTCGPRGCQYQGMARNWRNWRMGLNLPAQIRSELSWNIGAVKAFQNCFRPQIYLTPRFRLGGSL